MKVESIAECDPLAFCTTFDRHKSIIGIEIQFSVFFDSGRFTQFFQYVLANADVVQLISTLI